MKDLNSQHLKSLVKSFKGKRVAVLGDLMLDKYIWGSVSRISPEAPVPVVEVREESLCLGGAGNVNHNLMKLGAYPILVGIIGADLEGKWIRENVPAAQGLIIDKSRPTTIKTRIIAHHQQVVRVDFEKKQFVKPEVEKKIVEFLSRENYEGLIISDYNKGLLTPSLMKKVLALPETRGIPVFVDPKVNNFFTFSPVTLVTPNHYEAEQIVHHQCNTDSQVEKAGKKILSRIDTRYLILKRGEKGMTVFEKGRKPIHIPTQAKEVYDVTGAGDTVIAAASLALLAGANIREAAFLANAAAGVVVAKIGTAAASTEELLEAI
ncbi:MAG: D-glycero-beta-D-manno-heptose-7-phosphate kinase [Acidobacteriota bacterium]